jgi:hypothetical protein
VLGKLFQPLFVILDGAHAVFRKYFQLIAEPRVIRLVQFSIYVCMFIAGSNILLHPPKAFQFVLGLVLAYVFGAFITLGSLLGAISVLPGIWWLERVGIIALITGLGIYAIVIISLGSSPMGILVAIMFALTFVQRWLEIKGSQLAPREE